MIAFRLWPADFGPALNAVIRLNETQVTIWFLGSPTTKGRNMLAFQYHPDILTQFPNISAGIVLAQGLQNGPTPQALREAYQTEQQATITRIGTTPLSEIETLAAWRKAFRQFGVNPTKYRSAPEALLRRLTKKGDIPNINTIVDLVNLVSIRYGLPAACFDTSAFQGPTTVHVSDGTERFTPLGQSDYEHPEVGEVIFSDDSGLVSARRWCWRQSAESAANPKTQTAIFTIEAQHENSKPQIQAALSDLLDLLTQFTGGAFQSGVLDAARPSIAN
jgi:DNA/RNA-binding domain of Phe-tRNA-synthetase-like protein